MLKRCLTSRNTIRHTPPGFGTPAKCAWFLADGTRRVPSYLGRNAVLLDEAFDEDCFFDVQVLPALEADGDGPVENIKSSMPLDLAGIGAKLATKGVAIGIIGRRD